MSEISTPESLAEFVAKKLEPATIEKPSKTVLEHLFNTLFYTSLGTEEGQFIKLTVTLFDHESYVHRPADEGSFDDWRFYRFKEPIPFTEKNLIKLSKAADPWSSSLAVYYDDSETLYIHGMIDQAIHFQSFLNFERDEKPPQPGVFQTMVTGVGILNVIFDFEPIATLNRSNLTKKYIDVLNYGEVSQFIKSHTLFLKKKTAEFLRADFPEYKLADWEGAVEEIYIQSISRILLKIQNYRHGGALLITNDYVSYLRPKYELNYNRLEIAVLNLIKASILHNSVTDDIARLERGKKRTVLMDDHQDYSDSIFNLEEGQNELKGAVRFIASLSCVDGLVLMSHRLNVKSFGTVINRKGLPENVYVSKTAAVGSSLSPMNPAHFGTRHQSMFAYCFHNPDSLGFVISQDGEIRAVKCINGELIVWENIKVHQFLKSKKIVRSPFSRS